MRVLIYHPYVHERRNALSFENLYNTSGFSGTETALIEIGKYLVSHGIEVHVLGISKQTFLDDSSGIMFYSLDTFNMRLLETYAWYTPLFYIHDQVHHSIIQHMNPMITRVFIWYHCIIEDLSPVHALMKNGFTVCGVCVSQWVLNYYARFFQPETLWLVENGISTLFYKEVPVKKRGSWVFHATFERGGSVAVQTFQRVQRILSAAATSMQIMSYYTGDSQSTQSYLPTIQATGVHFCGSVSKSRVCDILADSEYFVYPLVLPPPRRDMHYDTYACVILEALAMGVIVITWKVACIPIVYKDLVIALDPPADHPYDTYTGYNQGTWFQTEEALRILTNAVVQLEMQPQKKEALRQRGIAWARQQLWSTRGETMLERLRS